MNFFYQNISRIKSYENEPAIDSYQKDSSLSLLELRHTTKIKVILNEYQNEWSRACFKAFQTPHRLIATFLLAFILASNSLAAYLAIQAILQYLSYELATTTRTI
jgi:hypothetical protein